MVPTRGKKDELADGEAASLLIYRSSHGVVLDLHCWSSVWLESAPNLEDAPVVVLDGSARNSPRAGQERPVCVEGWRDGCPWIAVWSATLGSETQYHEEVKSLMFHFIKQAQELKAGNQNLQSSSVATSRRSASHGMG